MIKSVLTNHVLDIAEEKRENGSKIVQWDQTGKTNQRWMPEECGNGLYKFRSAHETSMFLAVQHQNKDDGGHL